MQLRSLTFKKLFNSIVCLLYSTFDLQDHLIKQHLNFKVNDPVLIFSSNVVAATALLQQRLSIIALNSL